MNFEFTTKQLEEKADYIITKAKSLGADEAIVAINEAIETNVDILKSEIENFETCYSSSVSLSVYINKKRGNVGISSTKDEDIDTLVTQALEIAKYTESDPDNGIAPKDITCKSFTQNLGLCNPIEISHANLITKTRELEALALNQDNRITNSNGASLGLGKYSFIVANSNGLNLGYQTTRYDTSLSIIGENPDGMQTDYWYSSSRDYNTLLSNQKIADTAVYRTLRRLNNSTNKIKSGIYPVIFEFPIAKSLIGSFLGAINGNNLYRKLSFLNNSLNTQVFANWINITEDPFIAQGLSSCYFDNEGVNVSKRNIVENGQVEGYQLNCYHARKLKMQSTGNCGGNHNILVSSNFNGGIHELAKNITKGLIVIETIGHGLNMVTGDYSVGASGLWVENGEIQYFVDNLTIAGNLKNIFKQIQYIGNDYATGSVLCGSMLVDGIQVSS